MTNNKGKVSVENTKATPNNKSNGNFGKHGWIFIIYGMLTFFITTAVSDSINNLSLPAFCEKYGWNYANLLSLRSIYGWVTIILMVIFGHLLHRRSAKRGAMIIGVIYAICLFIYPHITTSTQFMVLFFFLAVIATVWPQQFNAIITSNWFPRKKGAVIGWTTIGLPIGSGFGIVIYSALSGNIGMVGTHYIYAAITLACVIICAFFVSDYPEQKGCYPDNDKTMTREEAEKALKEGIELSKNSIWTNNRLLKTKEVWLVSISCGIMALFATGVMAQMMPRLLDLGYPQQMAIIMMTVAALFGGVGSVVVGIIDSHFGPKKTIIFVHVIAIVACVLNLIPNIVCVMTSLVFIGLVLGGASNCLLSMISTMWGRYNFPNAYGVALPINTVVGTSGVIIIAQAAARFSFNGAYVLVGVLSAIGILLAAGVKENSIEKIEEKEGYQRIK